MIQLRNLIVDIFNDPVYNKFDFSELFAKFPNKVSKQENKQLKELLKKSFYRTLNVSPINIIRKDNNFYLALIKKNVFHSGVMLCSLEIKYNNDLIGFQLMDLTTGEIKQGNPLKGENIVRKRNTNEIY